MFLKSFFFPVIFRSLRSYKVLWFVFQMELNKKRENDITRLRRELEEQAHQHEQSVNSMRVKQNQSLQELQDEIDGLKKAKSK